MPFIQRHNLIARTIDAGNIVTLPMSAESFARA
jgi:hypothetical protein